MAHHLRIANDEEPTRRIGQFVWTDTAQDILRSLKIMESDHNPRITMISGPPGSGKTSALKAYFDTARDRVTRIQAAKGEGTIRDFSSNFFSQYLGGAPAFTSKHAARETLERYMERDYDKDFMKMLIVDEAQYLNQKNSRTGQHAEVIEWLRAASENGDFHLVFCGDQSLENVIAREGQLRSRMVRPVIIPSVSRNDISAMTKGTAFSTPEAQHALYAIAQLAGGLRNVESVARIATAFAGTDHPTTAHLKAAIIDMKLAPRGVTKGGA